MLKALKDTISYVKQTYLLIKYALPIDRESPRGGVIKDAGFFNGELDPVDLQNLREFYLEKIKDNPNHKSGFLELPSQIFKSINALFEKVAPPIISYIGSDAKLDGISYGYSDVSDSDNSISALWHTDNVGLRLKIFVCLEGDGSQPTVLLPSRESNDFYRILKQAIIQLPRWFGCRNRITFQEEIHARHKSGSIFIFDTDVLHRGGYEKASSRRVILHLEFSNPKKHKYLKGPIGTNNSNSFLFHPIFLESKAFSSLLDMSRVQIYEDKCMYKIN